MIGWRARLGFLLPPGNPTVEPEMMALAPPGVSLHFNRMIARGRLGAPGGQSERNRMMVENIDATVEILALVNPDVIVLAHTATSYYLGREGEAELVARLEKSTGTRVLTAFGSVLRALERLGVRKLALGAPYSRETTLQGKAHLEAHGLQVVKFDNLKGCHQHLRRNRGARLWSRAAGRLRRGRGGVSERHRDADLARPRSARAGSGQAGHLKQLRDDVARAAHRRSAPADPRLRPAADDGLSEQR
ncbi:MAG: maleate cis-trans isomerase family protein [Stellaceae bacterium]